MKTKLPALLLFVAAFVSPALAQERTLHWKSLDVDTRLDADGRLHVVETQAIVFDGPWNGGERIFNLRGEQRVNLESFEEIDAAGARIAYSQASLDQTQSWGWHNANTLRWRARAADDPPFSNTLKTYVLTYTMDNVLMRREGRYRLSHDFAFADRQGIIETFTLKFAMDAAWQAQVAYTPEVERTNLRPGESFVLNVPLRYAGSGTPSARDLSAPVAVEERRDVAPAASAPVRYAICILTAIAIAILVVAFFAGEASRGRFSRLQTPESIDRAWLDEHLLSRPPEIVGAAWDEETGSAEVAALLARLAVEGKIATRVEEQKAFIGTHTVLHIEKTCAWEDLATHERSLLRALLGNAEKTDTDKVRKRYKKVGFNPAGYIEDHLEHSLPWSTQKKDRGEWQWIAGGFGAYIVATIAVGIFSSGDDAFTLVSWLLLAGFFTLIAAFFGRASRRAVRFPLAALAAPLAPMAFLLYLTGGYMMSANLRAPALAALGFLAFHVVRIVVRSASTADGGKRIAVRRTLLAARRWFIAELKKPDPQIDDVMFPYILAFGLGKNVDRWFRAFGGASPAGTTSSWTPSFATDGSGGANTSAARNWSGGGGAFGGAGATGSWSSAVSGISASISAPMSSGSSGSSSGWSSSGSSSSSSSSSGGSSGGGGGGGW